MNHRSLNPWTLAFTRGTQVRALKLALVVGSALVLINQWEACVGDAPVQWLKVALTYVVPYLVSTYSSARKDYEVLSIVHSSPGQPDTRAPHS